MAWWEAQCFRMAQAMTIRLNAIAMILCILCFGIITSRAIAAHSHGPATLPAWYNVLKASSPYSALQAKAQVYVCKVLTVEPKEQANDFNENGRIKLHVIQRLLGPAKKELDLPYHRLHIVRFGAAISDYPNVWPSESVKEGAFLLCFVIPDGYDPIAQPTPPDPTQAREHEPTTWPSNPDGAACIVVPLEAANDPAVAAYRDIIMLFSLRGTPQEEVAIKRAIQGGNQIIVQYAKDRLGDIRNRKLKR